MDRSETLEYLKISDILENRRKYNKIKTFYPDTGPLRRELYVKHLEFFKAGAEHQERASISANRCGKTIKSCFETTLHLTGEYPDWWVGRRFDHAVDWWAASDTSETTRDILQYEMLGQIGDFGSGMIPKHLLHGEPTKRRGIADAVDTVFVKHKSGGISTLSFKSYDQGREKFQGTAKHGVSLDEEPNEAIYFECLTRLMTTNGLMICTFTPLQGMSEIIMRFLYNQEKMDKKDE